MWVKRQKLGTGSLKQTSVPLLELITETRISRLARSKMMRSLFHYVKI